MSFDYEKKMWGINEVGLNPKFLGATKLKHALAALGGVRGRVLEIGCGGGAFARAIKKRRPELTVVGGDISQRVLKVAGQMGGSVSYRRADVYQLPFGEKSFAAVVSFDVWEHLQKPKRALREVFRVLKPGGVFHFFVPVEGGRLTLYRLLPKGLYEIKETYTGHCQKYTPGELLELLSEVGFKIKKAYPSCFYFYQLVDLAYFLLLKLRGRGAAVSIEGYLEFARGSFFDRGLGLARIFFGWLTYLEDEIFGFLPQPGWAGGMHITAVKGERPGLSLLGGNENN